MPSVSCYNLTKNFGGFSALSDVSLELPDGKIIGLLGPNGSGKTTLLKIFAGLTHPTSGEVLISGVSPSPETKKTVSYLPDRMIFSPTDRVSDCVSYYADFWKDFDAAHAHELFAMLNIDEKMKLKALSKGNQDKVSLILSISRRASLYLLDEPIGGVDPSARDFIIHTMLNRVNPDATTIISTHLIHDIEPILDGFIFLGNGRIIMSGDAREVRESSGKTLDELFREVFGYVY